MAVVVHPGRCPGVVGLHGGVPGGVVESRFGARGGARHVAVMGHKLVCIIMLLLARHSR